MKMIEGIIFDMDGCLYPFDRGIGNAFSQSELGRKIRENIVSFFMRRFNLTKEEALASYLDFKARFNGEVSLGLEKERGIPRSEYFSATWDFLPQEFMEQQGDVVSALSSLVVRASLLTAAPRIWADRVLEFLRLKKIFEQALFTGDPDIRKPDPRAFLQIAELWKLPPESIVSIGDQEETDILPAKSLGMITIRIGKNVQTQADFLAEDVVAALAILRKENML